MRRRRYIKDKKEIFFTQINAPDLFDIKYFEKSRPLRTLLGTSTEREATNVAARIFVDMLHLIIDDMITNRIQFVLPLPDFGLMRIADTTAWVKRYKFDPMTYGRVYSIVFLLTENMRKKITHMYFFRLWSHVYDKIRSHVSESRNGYPKQP